MKPREIARRQAWMRLFEATLTRLEPKSAGRIGNDWHTAVHLFNVGKSAVEAATIVAKVWRDARAGRS